MIKIEYNIDIYNPIAYVLKPTENFEALSSLEVNKVNTGYIIKGSVQTNIEDKIASSYGYVGEDYFLKNNLFSKYLLDSELNYNLDIEEILALNNTNYNDLSDLYKNNMHSAKNLGNNNFLLRQVLDNVNDAIFFTLDDNQLMTLVRTEITPPSNLVRIKDDNEPDITEYLVEKEDILSGVLIEIESENQILLSMENEDIVIPPPINIINNLYYFIINKTLKVELDDYLYLDNSVFKDQVEGFCTLETSFTLLPKVVLENTGVNSYILTTNEPTTITTNFPILFDGVLGTTYSAYKNELILLNISYDEHVYLSDIDLILEDNIYAVYEVKDNTFLKPYLLLYSESLFNNYDYNSLPLAETYKLDVLKDFKSNEELKKKYVIKQYKIKVELLNGEILYVYDEALYGIIKNNMSNFDKKYVKMIN